VQRIPCIHSSRQAARERHHQWEWGGQETDQKHGGDHQAGMRMQTGSECAGLPGQQDQGRVSPSEGVLPKRGAVQRLDKTKAFRYVHVETSCSVRDY